jgi:hypothetical protein
MDASSDNPSVAALGSRSLSIRTPRTAPAAAAEEEEPVTPNARLMESIYIVVTLGLGSPVNLPVFIDGIAAIFARYPRFQSIQVFPLMSSSTTYFDVLLASWYFLRLILSFANTNISRHILVLDIFIFAKDNMNRRE